MEYDVYLETGPLGVSPKSALYRQHFIPQYSRYCKHEDSIISFQHTGRAQKASTLQTGSPSLV